MGGETENQRKIINDRPNAPQRRDRNARQQYEMARATISVRRKQTIFDLIRDGA